MPLSHSLNHVVLAFQSTDVQTQSLAHISQKKLSADLWQDFYSVPNTKKKSIYTIHASPSPALGVETSLQAPTAPGGMHRKKDKYTDVLIKVELLPLPPTSLAPRAITVMRTSHLFPNT